MRWNHDRLFEKLVDNGWRMVVAGLIHTGMRAPDGRMGYIPTAGARRRKRFWSTAKWARVKKDMQLKPEDYS